MIKKIIIYIFVYLIVTLLMSPEELHGIWHNDSTSWLNIIVKFIIFLIAVVFFEQVIKPKIYKK